MNANISNARVSNEFAVIISYYDSMELQARDQSRRNIHTVSCCASIIAMRLVRSTPFADLKSILEIKMVGTWIHSNQIATLIANRNRLKNYMVKLLTIMMKRLPHLKICSRHLNESSLICRKSKTTPSLFVMSKYFRNETID